MELEQLRHFVKVAEHENMTRAAEQVRLSQPALSRSIARLETELGQPLFDRQSRKVALNDAGRLLLDRVRNILTMVDELKAEIGEDGQTGKVRIAAIPTVAPYFLPECLHTFHRKYPRAQVIVHEDTTRNLIKKISDGEIDIAIAALPITAKYLEVVPLFDEELLLVLPPDHPLAVRRTIRAEEIADLPFVLLDEAHCLSDNVVTFCRQKSFHPVSVERAVQLSMVQELVTLGHGISFVPAMARARDDSPTRVYRSLSGRKPIRTIAMITNPYRYQNQIVRHFQKHLTQMKASLGRT